MDTGNSEKKGLSWALGIRPLCVCCGGGEIRGHRGRYRHTKSRSRWQNKKARRVKPKEKEHR